MSVASGYRLRRAVVLQRGALSPAEALGYQAIGGADEVLVLSMAPGEPWQVDTVKYAPGEPVVAVQETLARHLLRAVRRRLRLSPDPVVKSDRRAVWRARLALLRADAVYTDDPELAALTGASPYPDGWVGPVRGAAQ